MPQLEPESSVSEILETTIARLIYTQATGREWQKHPTNNQSTVYARYRRLARKVIETIRRADKGADNAT